MFASLCLFFAAQDESLLKGRVQLMEVPAESLLGVEGDLDSCVYFIATGRLKVFRSTGNIDTSTSPQVHKQLTVCLHL